MIKMGNELEEKKCENKPLSAIRRRLSRRRTSVIFSSSMGCYALTAENDVQLIFQRRLIIWAHSYIII